MFFLSICPFQTIFDHLQEILRLLRDDCQELFFIFCFIQLLKKRYLRADAEFCFFPINIRHSPSDIFVFLSYSFVFMKFNFIELLLLGIFAAFANILGGLILFPKDIQNRFKSSLKYLLALGAGFMLAVNFIEIFPQTISLWQTRESAANADVFGRKFQ